MVYGIDAVGKVALGLAGVVVLSASANSVAILAEAVRRASVEIYDKVAGNTQPTVADNAWHLKSLVPYSGTKDWRSLGIAALKNVIVGTAALYVAHRFCPSLVTSANSLLSNVIPIHFTAHSIPLTRLAGL